QTLNRIVTVFTIHNLGYQGITEKKGLASLGIPDSAFTSEKLEFYGKVNIMKAGILYSDIITTVSPTYAEEITTKEFGYGLEGLLSQRRKDLYGILNGIDYEVYSPEVDPHLKARYSYDTLRGKAICRRELLQETGVKADGVPLVSYIGRLVSQKGLDILMPVLIKALQWGVPFFVLGEGEHLIEEKLRDIARKFSGRVFLKIGFDDVLARKLYAGSDIVVVPSRYEPCGLVQMIALRYGTIPVVRKTGGLSDTVVDYNPFTREGYGFVFEEYSESALWEALKRAFSVFTHKTNWRAMIKRAMVQDFSWARSVERYLEVYRIATKKKRP
ncbi:MAG: glycogen synthase, partial [Nitrospirae bacterium]